MVSPDIQVNPNAIMVSKRQEGNPVLKHIRNVRWQYADIVPDYQMGQQTCALFLSLRWIRLASIAGPAVLVVKASGTVHSLAQQQWALGDLYHISYTWPTQAALQGPSAAAMVKFFQTLSRTANYFAGLSFVYSMAAKLCSLYMHE